MRRQKITMKLMRQIRKQHNDVKGKENIKRKLNTKRYKETLALKPFDARLGFENRNLPRAEAVHERGRTIQTYEV